VEKHKDAGIRDAVARGVAYAEDGIYLAAGIVLAGTAAVITFMAGLLFVRSAIAGNVLVHAVEILDSVLLVLLIVEILHTIRVSIVEHRLLAEPFLVVALIAAVRRVLILLVEAAEFLPDQPERFERVLMEMGLLVGFVVVIVGSLVVLRRFGPS
jgi:hypothetical protein